MCVCVHTLHHPHITKVISKQIPVKIYVLLNIPEKPQPCRSKDQDLPSGPQQAGTARTRQAAAFEAWGQSLPEVRGGLGQRPESQTEAHWSMAGADHIVQGLQ